MASKNKNKYAKFSRIINISRRRRSFVKVEETSKTLSNKLLIKLEYSRIRKNVLEKLEKSSKLLTSEGQSNSNQSSHISTDLKKPASCLFDLDPHAETVR